MEAGMPSIVISRDSQFERVLPLQSKILIGRGPNNDVILDAIGVSRNHALIEEHDGRFFLIDHGSKNGTFIRGGRIQRHPLTDGTSFQIQNYLLTFVDDVGAQNAQHHGWADVTLAGSVPIEMMETLRQDQPAIRESGLQEKVFHLMKMVRDLAISDTGTDPGYLVLDTLLEITGAKRGIVALKKKRADPVFTHLRGFDPQGQAPKVSRTAFQRALSGDTTALLISAQNGAFSRSTEAWAETSGVKSILCVPLTSGGQPIGCIYLDHPDEAGVFSETDRDLIEAAAELIAPSLLPNKRLAGEFSGEDKRLVSELGRHDIIARSPKTLKVFRDCKAIARFNISVLIFGETGTGKEIIARYIHDCSGRSGSFIARNCSAITPSMFESELFGHEKGAFTGASEQRPGIFELADHGTLFLDEIGDMPTEQQAKVLRALQEQEIWRVGGKVPVNIDVRVIAATHKDIKTQRRQLKFRDDLYYRLANVEITAPSLKERQEDIGPLCEMILESFSQEHEEAGKKLSLSAKALRLLEAYDWPGNIRELRNTLIQIILKCDGTTIEPRHLKSLIDVYSSAPANGDDGPFPPLAEVEKHHILKALEITNWNKSAAAKMLSMDRNRLNRRLKSLGIKAPH
jgi:transcriptional regulator with GAF, ATPase, and Fis domain